MLKEKLDLYYEVNLEVRAKQMSQALLPTHQLSDVL